MSEEIKYPSANNQIVGLYIDVISKIPQVEFKGSETEPNKIIICTDISSECYNNLPKNLTLTKYHSGKEPKSVRYINEEYSKIKRECFEVSTFDSKQKELENYSRQSNEFFQSHILPFIKFLINENSQDFLLQFSKSLMAVSENYWCDAKIVEVYTIQNKSSSVLKIVVRLSNNRKIEISIEEFFEWIKAEKLSF